MGDARGFHESHRTTTYSGGPELVTVDLWFGTRVQLRAVELTDWADGHRSVVADGRYVRQDGVLGSHDRAGRWRSGTPGSLFDQDLPDGIAEIVEALRPGWWTGGDPR